MLAFLPRNSIDISVYWPFNGAVTASIAFQQIMQHLALHLVLSDSFQPLEAATAIFCNINTVVCVSAPQKALMNTEWYFLFCCQGQIRVLWTLGHWKGKASLWDEISEVILIFLIMSCIFRFNSWNIYFVCLWKLQFPYNLHFINTSHLERSH